jgi:hypothetical protein
MTDKLDTGTKVPGSRHDERQEERRARQAQALRRNLSRRKAQVRGREDATETMAADTAGNTEEC